MEQEGADPISVIAETGILGGGGQQQDATSGVSRKQVTTSPADPESIRPAPPAEDSVLRPFPLLARSCLDISAVPDHSHWSMHIPRGGARALWTHRACAGADTPRMPSSPPALFAHSTFLHFRMCYGPGVKVERFGRLAVRPSMSCFVGVVAWKAASSPLRFGTVQGLLEGVLRHA